MARERFGYDRSSKWLLSHQGGAILRVGGMLDIAAWRAAQPEVVQPRKLPDGLLEVRRGSETAWQPVVVEIETFPDSAAASDIMDDVMLVYQDRRVLPDVLVLVLHKKGNVQVAEELSLRSAGGLTELRGRWRVVRLWELPAADLLATADPGVMPWVPLAHIDGPAEPVPRECARVIEDKAPPGEKGNLLAVAEVLAGLRYNTALVRAIFGGGKKMIESPILQEIIAETRVEWAHEIILSILTRRFGSLPPEVRGAVLNISDPKRLRELSELAAVSGDLAAFHQGLGA